MEQNHTPKQRKGSFIPAFCNALGIVMLAIVIVTAIPATVPKLFGYQIYAVTSGSMQPAIPTGSLIYVKPVSPEDIAVQDVIAFQSEGSVITHRVMQNRQVEGEFITKGDANQQEDISAVAYADVIGRVSLHIPVLGNVMVMYTSTIGKAYVLCFAACGVMLNMLASRLREHNAQYDELDELDDDEDDE